VSNPAIRVEHLSKAYRIGLKEQRHETLAGAIASLARAPFDNYRAVRSLSRLDDARVGDGSRPLGQSSASSDVVWALQDVSFELQHGEVLGIIGRNGAGKSTLLKILSRITEPTAGRAIIYGRVGSLLEVGTGFHPDLTGRENVYLNGTILGMTKREVDGKFDDIVRFAEVPSFIDTPVKRYSSGMRVRLAFAVAAYLEPEILIVDEVLAVGDLNFQRKCVGKMGEIAQQGRTVLFVSHNMAAIVELCQRGLVLENGKIGFEGTAGESVNYYVQRDLQDAEEQHPGNGLLGFHDLRANGSFSPKIRSTDPLDISLVLKGTLAGNPWLYLIMEDASGRAVVHCRRSLSDIHGKGEAGDCTIRASLPPLFLSPGVYSLHFKALCTTIGGPSRIVSERLPIEVRGQADSLGRSVLSPDITWQVVS
jgi:lipopolysaccharide transport system ATP-binding protein